MFVRTLCDRDNAKVVEAWLKNTPVGFYTIEYAWKKSEHPKRGGFSPDFFIRSCRLMVSTRRQGNRITGDRASQPWKSSW
jgi:hypothetical protein